MPITLDDVVLVDFETRSRADLKAIGGRNYAAHPSTEVLCACFYADGEHFEWRYHDTWMPPRVPILVAHNAIGFDRHVWTRMGWPEPDRWIDTAELARSSGLPAKLEDLGARILGVQKDTEGSRFTKALSLPSRAAARLGELPEITPEVLDRVVAYCRQDVEVMVALWPHVEDFIDLEPEVYAAWFAANERGVEFDADLARALLAADAKVAADVTGLMIEAIRDDLFRPALLRLGVGLPQKINPAALRTKLARACKAPKRCTCLKCTASDPARASTLIQARLFVSGLRHAATFCEWIRRAGGETHSAEYDNVEPLTRSPIAAVAKLARERLVLASIAAGKCSAGLARVSADGRMRDNVRYFGAHTGRGAGSGMQLQNLPHPEGLDAYGQSVVPKKIDGVDHPGWDDARVCAEADAPREWNQAEISMLLRACVKAPAGGVLVASDYSGVEARGNAWAAGQEDALALFRTGGDAYKPLACRLFAIAPDAFSKKTHFFERDTSKKANLGCGYGMGAPKFMLTAEKGGMKWRDPRECKGALCVDPVCGAHERDRGGKLFTHGAKLCVTAWREMNPRIVEFWYALERAAIEAVADRRAVSVDCAQAYEYTFAGEDLALMLPSGRPLVYRRAVLVEGKYGPQVRYEGAHGPEHTYGGKLCENAIQATCRDLLVAGMVACEAAGLPVVLTVHDEIVCEAPEARAEESLALLNACMTRLPAWAEGFPIAVEGWSAVRYRK